MKKFKVGITLKNKKVGEIETAAKTHFEASKAAMVAALDEKWYKAVNDADYVYHPRTEGDVEEKPKKKK